MKGMVMKKTILISLFAVTMVLIAFVGCEKPDPIEPNEVQQQQTVDDTVIAIQDTMLTYFVGEWECIDSRYSNNGGLFLSFSRDYLNVTNNATYVYNIIDDEGHEYQRTDKIQSIFNYPTNGREDDNGYGYSLEADDTLRAYFEYVKENYGQTGLTMFIDQIPNNPIYILNLDIPVEYSKLAIHVISNDTVSLRCISGLFSHAENAPSQQYNLKRIR
jgi:hypothetical protein